MYVGTTNDPTRRYLISHDITRQNKNNPDIRVQHDISMVAKRKGSRITVKKKLKEWQRRRKEAGMARKCNARHAGRPASGSAIRWRIPAWAAAKRDRAGKRRLWDGRLLLTWNPVGL
ncbi:hypothetical protein H0G86_001159 [Trichoderma simmonsii]|uniref:Uncharacterized protein n=1 Tax=Trichoderma simmonsii TaxID=1491479 RepID=A0A8G0L120_9HYPO|nr:hypothetical protein H0G86_001159 [Trichoderma simmonsii]